ncbi:MAG: phosphotransferase [Micromonosporaceae bacterium]|nr:phosphotransferase [Micromonosporaceae bacterium]
MAPQQADDHLIVKVRRRGWRAYLAVQPPTEYAERTVTFGVAPLGPADNQRLTIRATVRYTTATSTTPGTWPRWHAKIYRCATQGEAEALRTHLTEQATKLDVNHLLPTAGSNPARPPWAIVPVFVRRGDGREDPNSAPPTSFPSGDEQEQVRTSLPAWCGGPVTSPELYLFALSPQVDRLSWQDNDDEDLSQPRVEQLDDFVTLAAGLDLLHQRGWVHGDIKPDNVCQADTTGYALIDADSATRMNPAPTALRITPAYAYGPLRQHLAQRMDGRRPRPPDSKLLIAHDRFGFALLVVSELAGRYRAEELVSVDDDPSDRRPIDDHDTVVEWLSRWWGPRWRPLIEVLAQPFGPVGTPAGSIESYDPSEHWLTAWVGQLRASAQPVDRPSEPPAAPGRYAEELDRIRAVAGGQRVAKARRAPVAWAAVEQVALEVAMRAFRRWGAASAGVVIGIVAVALFGALVLRK